MKKIAKRLISYFRKIRFKIKGKNLYIGKNCNIKKGSSITFSSNVSIRPYCSIFPHHISIGQNCDIGERSRIAGNVIIEDNVLFGPNIFVCSYDHDYRNVDLPIIQNKEYEPRRNGNNEILIGEGSWIGTNSVISGDVHIGKHCAIGANSVVLRDIPDYCVAVGSPARVIKRYNFLTKSWEKKGI